MPATFGPFRLLATLATVLASGGALAQDAPRFSFAVLADIQYADKDAAGRRAYRDSLRKLEAAAAAIDAANPAFVVQLGDLIDDGGFESLGRVLPLLDRIRAPKRHVIGNHDLSIPRQDLLRRLGLERGWHDFEHGGWRFIVLDGMHVSAATPGGRRMLAALERAGRKNAAAWNGGIGEEQKAWLRGVLESAARDGEPAVVFCHFPVLEASSTAAHLLWNHEEIVSILEGAPAVVAWFNGHDHRGGYARRNGIHYVTFPGMVESGAANSWTIVDVYPDRLQLRTGGGQRMLVVQLARKR